MLFRDKGDFMSENHVSENKKLAVKVLIISAILVAIGVFVILFWFAIHVMFLVFGGILLAVSIRGIGDWISRKTGISKAWAITITILVILILVILFSTIFGMQIYYEVLKLTEELPRSLDHLRQMLQDSQLGSQILKVMPGLDQLFQGVWKNVPSFFFSLSGIIVSFVFIIFLGIYLAYNPELYIRGILWLFPSKKRPHIEKVLNYIGYMLHWWLIGRVFSMTIIGLLSGIGLWLIGIPLALTLGVFAGLVSFIPYLGPIFSFVPVALLALAEGWQPIMHIFVLFIIIQTVESYILTPMIIQRTVLIPPLLTLTAQVLFGMAAGVVGIVFALPVTATLIILVKFFYIQDVLGDDIDIVGE